MKIWSVLCVLCVLCGESFGVDRNAFTFVSYDLEVRVDPSGGALSARGKIRLRNDTNSPQNEAVLQISSSLDWRLINIGGNDVQYSENDYTTGIDHTNQVNEAIVKLPQAVAPNATVEIEVGYSGRIDRDSTRLTEMGTPQKTADRSDWDRIEEPVTAVRGIGYVAWYPVAMPAVLVAQPDYFSALAAWKERERATSMRINLCWISDDNDLSVVANGVLVGVKRGVLGATDETATHGGCSLFSYTNVGSTVPSFAIAKYESMVQPHINAYYLPDQASFAKDYVAAAEKVEPLDEEWFGAPKAKVTVVQLPDTDAVPFETGPMLFTPLQPFDRKGIEQRMVHQLVHASFVSPRLWIEEGLAHFAMALLREQDGRAAAVGYMDQFLGPLQKAEKTPSEHGMATSDDEILYRIKAMFVWWMLRDMVGNVALQKALAAYRPGDDKSPSYLPDLIAREAHRDLSWFFDEWVYRDRGLPDFQVLNAAPRQLLESNGYVVTLTIENLGNITAEVPVIVRTGQGDRVKRLLVKAKDKTVDRIEVGVVPTEVLVNDGTVPESDMTNNGFVMRPPPRTQ